MRTCPKDTQSLRQIIGAPLAAGLLYMNGLAGLRGWQWLFIIEGCLTIIYGVILRVRPLGVLDQALSRYAVSIQEDVLSA